MNDCLRQRIVPRIRRNRFRSTMAAGAALLLCAGFAFAQQQPQQDQAASKAPSVSSTVVVLGSPEPVSEAESSRVVTVIDTKQHPLVVPTIEDYLRRNIHYTLDPGCLQTIRLFRQYAAEVEVLPPLPALRFL